MKSIISKFSVFILGTILLTACQTAFYIQDQPMRLSKGAAQHFEQYLADKEASDFYVDILGQYATYYYCPDRRCRPSLRNKNVAKCNNNSGSACGLLATKSSIHWKNAGNFMPYRSEIVYETYGDYFYDE